MTSLLGSIASTPSDCRAEWCIVERACSRASQADGQRRRAGACFLILISWGLPYGHHLMLHFLCFPFMSFPQFPRCPRHIHLLEAEIRSRPGSWVGKTFISTLANFGRVRSPQRTELALGKIRKLRKLWEGIFSLFLYPYLLFHPHLLKTYS